MRMVKTILTKRSKLGIIQTKRRMKNILAKVHKGSVIDDVASLGRPEKFSL